MEFEKLLTKIEVAEILNVTTRTIENYEKKGILNRVKTGGTVRFHPSQVRALLDQDSEQNITSE